MCVGLSCVYVMYAPCVECVLYVWVSSLIHGMLFTVGVLVQVSVVCVIHLL